MNLFFVRGSGPNAAVVTPALTGTLLPGITRDSLLTLLHDGERTWLVGEGKPGPVTMQVRAALTDLHQGRAEDPQGWVCRHSGE